MEMSIMMMSMMMMVVVVTVVVVIEVDEAIVDQAVGSQHTCRTTVNKVQKVVRL